MKLEFRDLRADEIELRVGSTKRKEPSKPKSDTNPVVGFQLLLYKNARVDANVLDETVGPFNWCKEYYQVKNTMFCRVGIKDKDTGEWVYKSDAGDDDFQTEQVKGEASDSFKRASFAWGLGRKNLYYGPFIWIKCSDTVDETSKLYVSEVEYKDSIISKIVIKDRFNDEVVFSYPRNTKVAETGEKAPKKASNDPNQQKGSIRDVEKEVINSYLERLQGESRDNFFKWLDKNFGTMSVDMLSAEQGVIVARRLMNNGKQ